MNNNFHQTPEQIIKNATAEQRILWNSIFLKFGETIGISQFNYTGPNVGTEFLTYSANKLYFALQMSIFSSSGPASASYGQAQLFDETNTLMFLATNNAPVWDATAAALKYSVNIIELKNLLFSRFAVVAAIGGIHFIGYRLAI
jgi:hypothetical protein